MKRLILLLFFIFSSILILADIPNMIDEFDVAAKIANIEKKALIIVFSSKDCYYCKLFESRVYPKAAVQTLIKNNCVFAELYLGNNEHRVHFRGREFTNVQFAQAFGVKGTPTFVFFTDTGTPITYYPGYPPENMFVKILKYLSQKLFEKGVEFKDYLKKKDGFVGKQVVIDLKSEKDAQFLVKNDPYIRVLKLGNEDKIEGKNIQIREKNIKKLDPYLRYIICKDSDGKRLLELLEKNGFLNIYLIHCKT